MSEEPAQQRDMFLSHSVVQLVLLCVAHVPVLSLAVRNPSGMPSGGDV